MSLSPTTSLEEITALPPPEPARWWKSLRRDKSFWTALIGLAVLLIVVVVGPWVSPYSESVQDLSLVNRPPDRAHPFGTDTLGRDLMTRTFYGGRISLAVGVAGALISLLIGIAVGGLAGFAGGWVDRVIMRFIDFLYGVPLLLIVIALRLVLESGLKNIFVALGLVFWLQMARQVRARVNELRTREFVDAARALGVGPVRIFARHVLPNAMGVIVVTTTFMIPEAIFAESFLSFIGLGVDQPHASWGTLASEGLEAMRSAPHVLFFPAMAICLTMFLFQTMGEGLRRAFDPRTDD